MKEYLAVEYPADNIGVLSRELNEEAEGHPEATLVTLAPVIKNGTTTGFIGIWERTKEEPVRDYKGF